jgi:hypothetical protein
VSAATAAALLVAALLILLANLGVLGITVKLYTEILKDRKFDVREARSGHDGGRQLPATGGAR